MSVTGLKVTVAALSLALFAALLATAGVDAKRQEAAQRRANVALEAAINPQIARGRQVFEKYSCNGCHGRDGAGGIRNLNSESGGQVPDLRHLSETYTAEELAERIRKGVPEVGKADPTGPDPPLSMPPFRDLIAGQDLKDLVAFLRGLAPPPEAKADTSAW